MLSAMDGKKKACDAFVATVMNNPMLTRGPAVTPVVESAPATTTTTLLVRALLQQ